MRIVPNQRGDTIIEVMLAFSVFALIAIGALTVMNQGTANAQNVLETSLVRQEIDNQAEMLRFTHRAFIANPNDTTGPSSKFAAVLNEALSDPILIPSTFGNNCTQSIPGTSDKRFVLDTSGNQIPNVLPSTSIDSSTMAPYAQLNGNTSYGLWIEPVLSNRADAQSRYIDFHVRACWDSASGGTQRTLGTIIRLYVPENAATNTVAPVSGAIPTNFQKDFTLDGSQSIECFRHNSAETQTGTLPTWAPLAKIPAPNGVSTTDPETCVKVGKILYNCSNYDARYQPNIPVASNGKYSLVLSYGDRTCGAGNPITSNYSFKGAVYVNGAASPRATFSLDSSTSNSTSVSPKLNIGQLNAGDTIEIRWWNNQFYGGMQDPDFYIEQLTLKWESV